MSPVHEIRFQTFQLSQLGEFRHHTIWKLSQMFRYLLMQSVIYPFSRLCTYLLQLNGRNKSRSSVGPNIQVLCVNVGTIMTIFDPQFGKLFGIKTPYVAVSINLTSEDCLLFLSLFLASLHCCCASFFKVRTVSPCEPFFLQSPI